MVGEKEMSERHRETKTFTNVDFNDPHVPSGNIAPVRCPVHGSKCFMAAHDALTQPLHNPWGFWLLKNPLNLVSLMSNGINKKLLTLSAKALYLLGSGTWVSVAYANIYVYGDTVQLYKTSNLTHDNNKWIDNTIETNLSLDGVSLLSLTLEQVVAVLTGYMAIHDADITIAYEYYNEVPNVKGDLEVEVIDVDTGSALSGFAVRLLSGTTLLKRGVTGKDGRVLWTGIDEGSYTLKVYGIAPTYWSTGYETTEQTAVIVGGVVNTYTISMPLLPKLALPWWTWYAVGGAAVLGTIIAVPKVIGYSVSGAKKAYRGARTAGERVIKEVRYIRREEEEEE